MGALRAQSTLAWLSCTVAPARRTIIANVRAGCASRRGGGNARGAETSTQPVLGALFAHHCNRREAVTRVAADSNVTRSTRRPTEGTPSSGDRRPGAETPGDHPSLTVTD